MNIEDIAVQVAETIQKEANINAIFGEPKKLDEHAIIPVARVSISFGAGGGAVRGAIPKLDNDAQSTKANAHGNGIGGGLEIEVHPLGFIRDTPEGAQFVAIDPTPEGLLGKVEHLIKGLRGGGPGREDKQQPGSEKGS